MRRARVFLAGTLVLLFLGLSFNAYACLMPLFGAADVKMGSGCSAPEEQPVRQFCDAFKTLGVQSSTELQPAIDRLTFCPEGITSSSLLLHLASQNNRLFEQPGDGPPQDILLKTAVLRI